jgi:peptidoglycan/LPS O-acetylase OafA/YrhL
MAQLESGALPSNNFDFLRLFFACLVIFSHSFALISGTDATEPLSRLTGGYICSGELAVNGFFAISGYLITHSWMRSRGQSDFLLRRARRIYPGFAAAALVVAFVVIPAVAPGRFPAVSGGMLKDLAWGIATLKGFDRPNVFSDNPVSAVNGSLWSVPFEAWCYVGVALLGALGLVRNPKPLLPLFVLSLCVSVAFAVLQLRPGGKILGVILGSPRTWARLLPYFLAGMVAYVFRDRIRYTARGSAIALAILVATTLVPHGLSASLPVAGPYLIFAFAFNPSLRLQAWTKRGDFSYGTYLYAFPIQQLLIHWFGPTQPLLLFLVSAPLSVAAGATSWYIVERWFLRRSSREPLPTNPEGELHRVLITPTY